MSEAAWAPILLAVLSGIKVLLVVLGWGSGILEAVPGDPLRWYRDLAFALVFGGSGLFLLVGSRRDARAFPLGVCFALVASSFGGRPVAPGAAGGWLAGVLGILPFINPETFFPWFLWRFFSAFPHVRSVADDGRIRRVRIGVLVLGLLLFGINLLLLAPGAAALPAVSLLNRNDPAGLYWLLLFGTACPALGYGFLRARQAGPEERRRTNLLVTGVAAGSLPILLIVSLAVLSSAFFDLLVRPPWFQIAGLIVFPTLLATPLVTVFAVLARGALDIRLVIRQAIRYALARYTVATAAAVPFLLLAVLLWRSREETLTSVVTGRGALSLLLLGVAGALALRFRKRALAAIDRRYFRGSYDARRVLSELVRGVREVQDVKALAELMASRIREALHPRFVFVLTLNPLSRCLESPGRELPPLPEAAAIASFLRQAGRPQSPLSQPPMGLRDLPEWERHWLEDSDAHLLVPLVSADLRLLGLVLLGQRLSELPFTREDVALLEDIAAAASETLDRKLLPPLATTLGVVTERSGPGAVEPVAYGVPAADAEGWGSAGECVACGQMGPAHLSRCPVCGGEMQEALVPLLLRGVFRMEARIGRGGMGVVYRARDLTLERPVAVKTLIHADPSLARRLRREARAMASVTHANLATIFGAESWRGVPTLLVEYLPGGTLDRRLERGPRDVPEALDLGLALADGVACLHQAGILHRDIKPSNIGFGADGRPKLLDFGLATFLSGVMGAAAGMDDLEPEAGSAPRDRTRTNTLPGRIRGTVPYLSPEALAGTPAGVAGDLWSLSVVLYETVAGLNPFLGLWGAARVRAPDIRDIRPSCPPRLAGFFSRALSPDPASRPPSIAEFRAELVSLKA